jgi:hypothetical protein
MHKCKQCGKKYEYQSELYKHERMVHEADWFVSNWANDVSKRMIGTKK